MQSHLEGWSWYPWHQGLELRIRWRNPYSHPQICDPTESLRQTHLLVVPIHPRMLSVFDDITAKEQERLGANRDIQATNRIILNSITGAPR